MKFSHILPSYLLLALLPGSIAYPGMGGAMKDIRRSALSTRQESKQLIGDLKTLKDSQLTSIGKDIKAILLAQKSAESAVIDTSIPPGTAGSSSCNADPCCVWKVRKLAPLIASQGLTIEYSGSRTK